jgi:2-polyprenyl-3-methyl-5-hydroxy-6-metoxy-1,4-benzoquinol methylase
LTCIKIDCIKTDRIKVYLIPPFHINKCFKTISDIEILDVACGIGVVGEELRAAGYTKVRM